VADVRGDKDPKLGESVSMAYIGEELWIAASAPGEKKIINEGREKNMKQGWTNSENERKKKKSNSALPSAGPSFIILIFGRFLTQTDVCSTHLKAILASKRSG
jgi:hypothetical protein